MSSGVFTIHKVPIVRDGDHLIYGFEWRLRTGAKARVIATSPIAYTRTSHAREAAKRFARLAGGAKIELRIRTT